MRGSLSAGTAKRWIVFYEPAERDLSYLAASFPKRKISEDGPVARLHGSAFRSRDPAMRYLKAAVQRMRPSFACRLRTQTVRRSEYFPKGVHWVAVKDNWNSMIGCWFAVAVTQPWLAIYEPMASSDSTAPSIRLESYSTREKARAMLKFDVEEQIRNRTSKWRARVTLGTTRAPRIEARNDTSWIS
jgi:hypothetical protein